ncbi:MAG: EFR1 family ferrodoxin [Lachnospiraceae bacterium]|nr:EFR1 family ferrodoxin [Lachnospiraceae bacterium]
MIGIYFSGTGNTKYCVEKFLEAYEAGARAFSIEEDCALHNIEAHEEIVIGYPVQYSTVPKILRDYITAHQSAWKGKKVFVIATMGLFSGDGAGVLARLLQKNGAVITGGLHLRMPDSICDEKVLKKPLSQNRLLVKKAELKIRKAAGRLKNGRPPRDGLGFGSHLAGFFGQRLYFGHKTKAYSAQLRIDAGKCVGCGKCVGLCPMKNLHLNGGKAVPDSRCTMCYRCINECPAQAITLLGKEVVEQGGIGKYL